ncbi:MAG TPA: hypothetical protein VES20_19055 [Bryobacteraceae bacterium]|nr:hypothetical protein [Bryobacteraceae bacterium]
MDQDRKYRQHGYHDADRDRRDNGTTKPKAPGPGAPRSLQDPNGPRLPRLVQTVTASRCYACSSVLPQATDFTGTCPKCNTDLHCCKQCSHFEPSTRFQCLKPIPERLPYKDKRNDCPLFTAKVTVMRDAATPGAGAPSPVVQPDAVRTPNDARAAFDSLFKK